MPRKRKQDSSKSSQESGRSKRRKVKTEVSEQPEVELELSKSKKEEISLNSIKSEKTLPKSDFSTDIKENLEPVGEFPNTERVNKDRMFVGAHVSAAGNLCPPFHSLVVSSTDCTFDVFAFTLYVCLATAINT